MTLAHPSPAVILVIVGVLVLAGTDLAGADQRAQVTRVIDGDTVEVATATSALDIRLLGVDTPETVHPTEPVECFGPEASAFAKRRLEGARVRLEYDVERLDRYERTLAYLWLNGRLFNRLLVRRGFATVLIYQPNDKYADVLQRAEAKAQAEERGLWGACLGGGDVEDPQGGGTNKCDSSYPDVCIPSPPPDLDCGEISYRDFRVTGSDPHGFDGNGDGHGCET